MKISTRSRYGLRLLINLAINYPVKPLLLKEIASNEEISEKYLSLIILPLKGAGFINSTRGAHGGYLLTKSPSEITVYDAINVLEGNISIVECVLHPQICQRLSVCTTRNFWCELNETIISKMKSVTLQDLIDKYNPEDYCNIFNQED
ncbi:hypothetical protein BVX93_01620 [bacterium B13(2017)]|nr:hypothetical protein BVX93_01620 [bacterium B13(2017)]